ncbi:MAG: DUF1648 domain-containing protein [Sphingobacteriia bacterium]|nr:DUF1648 domain-containing protein [Sphingobacteriia bacterium]
MYNEEQRPVIKIELSKTDKLIESIALAGLLFMWLYVLYAFTKLPDTIPIHYNYHGKADNYGSKYVIFILPLVISALFLLLTILNHYPHKFNYLKKITEDNAMQQYKAATKSLRIVKLVIVLFMNDVVFSIIKGADTKETSLGFWFLPLFLLAIILPIVVLLIKANKSN